MNKKIKKVSITPGCISCGSCEAVCPQVFEVKDIAYVKDNADLSSNQELICEAAEMCPVSVIKVEKEE
jgi:ferredoxin